MPKVTALKKILRFIRQISGDDAYECYLIHWHKHHAEQGGEPQSRAAFFKAELERKWHGVKRCC
jgi:uncharacterized short protein YbdD (DUF466 family)